MAVGDIKTFNIDYTGLHLTVNAVDMADGTVKFFITCTEGFADLNALYWGDDVNDGSQFDLGTKKDNSLNMNGSGVDFDDGMKLSPTGLGTAGVNKSTFITAGETLTFQSDHALNWDDLDAFGVRATSTSTAGGSIKGTDTSSHDTDAPCVLVDDAAPVVEGSDASFKIHLDQPYLYDVVISYTTTSGSAQGGSDYTTTTGTVTIAAGQTEATITVHTLADGVAESTEAFTLDVTGMKADLPGDDLALNITDPGCDLHGTGTILDHTEAPPPANQPPDAVDDNAACVTELSAAIAGVSGNVLANDTDPDHDTLQVTKVNDTALVFDVNGVAHVGVANGTLDIKADGSYTYHYTSAYSATELNPSFTYTISDGHDHTDTATVTLCVDPLADPGRGTALSPGAWTHNFNLTNSETLPAGLLSGSTTFDAFFNLDDLGPRTWSITVDPQGPTPPTTTALADITLQEALNYVLGTTSGSSSPDIGNESALAMQAATAVADFYDTDHQAEFVAAYIYQRAIDDNNGTLADNPYDTASVLADLKLQVHNTFDGVSGAYTATELTHILDYSHEA